MNVKLGPSFFKSEVQIYRSPLQAFWRENLQNSYDAHASRIDIAIESDGDLTKITFADNGIGMDLKTLEDVYFILGESTKTGNSVGGYGRARMLTCFAQERYELTTKNILVKGCGSEWNHEETNTKYHGVKLTVWMLEAKGLEDTLRAYLKTCHLENVAITINGERWNTWTYKNKFERDLSFGKVYTNKSKESGVLVRVKGVTMFSPWCSAPFLVIIEVDENRSREILQASRDGLLRQYNNELESFIAELNIDKQSALRQKRSKSILYKGTGLTTSNRSKKMDAEKEVELFCAAMVQNGSDPLPDNVAKAMIAMSPERRQQVIQNGLKQMGIEEPTIAPAALHSSGYINEEERRELEFELFDVMVEDDTTSNSAIRKVIESYYPQNWDLLGQVGSRYDRRYGKRVAFRAGVEKYKLLVLFKAACQSMIRLMQDNLQRGPEEITWSVGWIFSDHAEASCKTDGNTWLLLNPCDAFGKMRLSLSDKRDLIEIISTAAHEVCHIVYSEHDERFANLLNDLLEEAMANLNEVLGHMKLSKQNAEERLDRLAETA